jgi:hypothetical protein
MIAIKLFLYYLISISLISFKKDGDVPPIEQPPITAENNFFCYINGGQFIPENFSSFPNNFDNYKVLKKNENNRWFSLFRNRDLFIYDPESPHKLIEFNNTCSSIYPGDDMSVTIGFGVINNWNVSYG